MVQCVDDVVCLARPVGPGKKIECAKKKTRTNWNTGDTDRVALLSGQRDWAWVHKYASKLNMCGWLQDRIRGEEYSHKVEWSRHGSCHALLQSTLALMHETDLEDRTVQEYPTILVSWSCVDGFNEEWVLQYPRTKWNARNRIAWDYSLIQMTIAVVALIHENWSEG